MTTINGTPAARLLSASVPLAFGLTLVSTVLYAINGWEDDPAGAVVQILGAVAGMLAIVQFAAWLTPGWAAAVLAVGMLGAAGNVGYGFNVIETTLGGPDLVEASGAATIIKPLGLCGPLALLLLGIGLALAHRVTAVHAGAIVLGAVLFPISRIGNIVPVALAADIVLLIAAGSLPFLVRDDAPAGAHRPRAGDAVPA